MNSRERVIAAINHRPHDRVPLDIGGTYATGFTVSAYGKLRSELGISSGPIHVVDCTQMLAEVEMPVMEALDTDVLGLYLGGGQLHGWQDWTMPDGTEVRMPQDLELKQRSDGGWEQLHQGVLKSTMPCGGFYFDPVEYPQWRCFDPSTLTDEMLKDIARQARCCHQNTDKAIVLNSPYAISSSTNVDFMCALLQEKEEAHERLKMWADSIVACLGKLLEAVKGYVSIMSFSGDAGSQKAALFSPDIYREMIVPHMRKVPEYLHRNSDIKFFLHSCGSVYELVEHFIEMGVDILNPLQLSAANMEPEGLVNEFGGRIVFWGGGCDSQQVLPYGTANDVGEEVKRRMKAYGAVPGFVFSQVHNIQPDVPVENILAMIEEAKASRIVL